MTSFVLPGTFYTHKKSGETYFVVARGNMEEDKTPVVVYRSSKGEIWVRPESKFVEKFKRKEILG